MTTYYVYCITGNTTRYSRVAFSTDYEMSPSQKSDMETDLGITVEEHLTIELPNVNAIDIIEFDDKEDLVVISVAEEI